MKFTNRGDIRAEQDRLCAETAADTRIQFDTFRFSITTASFFLGAALAWQQSPYFSDGVIPVLKAIVFLPAYRNIGTVINDDLEPFPDSQPEGRIRDCGYRG